MAEPEFKTYLCEYPYEGSHWNFEIKAPSLEDADARLRAMCFAKVKGECLAVIPVPGGNMIERGRVRMKIDDPASYYRDPEQYRRLIEESLAECEDRIRQLQREHGPIEETRGEGE